MKLKQLQTGILVIFLLLCNLAAAHAADIVETTVKAGSFKHFLAALKTAGLMETLKTSGPYTVFAPSDQAFAKFSKETWNEIAQDKQKLANVMARHILPGKTLIADVKPGKVQTLRGATVRLSSDNGKVMIDASNVTQSDMLADNGVIHEIDTVIMQESESGQ